MSYEARINKVVSRGHASSDVRHVCTLLGTEADTEIAALRKKVEEAEQTTRVLGATVRLMQEDKDALLKRAEEAEADAARYRWLRLNPVKCANFADDATYVYKHQRPDLFDAAIDAARKETP